MTTRGKLLLWSSLGLLLVLLLLASVVFTLVVMGTITTQVEEALRDNPALVNHLGTIEKGSFSLNWSASLAQDDSDTWVYDIKGTKGSGKATVKSSSTDWDSERIVWARLELPSGQTVELVHEEATK